MPRLVLALFLFAAPASSESPTETVLDFIDSHVDKQTQVEWFKTYLDVNESFRKSVKRLGDALRKESKHAARQWARRR